MYERVKVSPKYQVVIPQSVRETLKSVEPGTDAYVIPIDETTIKITLKPKSWVEDAKGIAKGFYGNNPLNYIKKIRNEWEKKYKKA